MTVALKKIKNKNFKTALKIFDITSSVSLPPRLTHPLSKCLLKTTPVNDLPGDPHSVLPKPLHSNPRGAGRGQQSLDPGPLGWDDVCSGDSTLLRLLSLKTAETDMLAMALKARLYAVDCVVTVF